MTGWDTIRRSPSRLEPPPTGVGLARDRNAGNTPAVATGLLGAFDVRLEWTPHTPAVDGPPPGPSVFTALQERLGLKLESRTGPVDVVVVEHAEKFPTDN